MSMHGLRAALSIFAIVIVPLASRAWAEGAQIPRTMATVSVSGMT